MGTGPFHIVLNPASGSGAAADERRAVLTRVFREAGRPFEFAQVASPQDLPEGSRQAAEAALAQGGVLVAVGGDGTLNAAAQAAVRSGCVFAAVPQGTFNFFGRVHGLSQDEEEAARALLRATPQPVQVGLINQRVFLVNASLGLYPQVMEDREAFKQRFGRRRWVALVSAVATIFRWRHQLAVEIEADGARRTLRTPTLFVCNNALQMQRLGYPEEIVRRVGQGCLAAMVLKPIGTWAILGLLVRGVFGQLGDAQQVECFTFERLTVRMRGVRRAKVAADGEIGVMTQPITFEVSPRPLLLMTPAPEDRLEPQ